MSKIKGYIFGDNFEPTPIVNSNNIDKKTLDIAYANNFIKGFLYLIDKENIEWIKNYKLL